MCTLILTKWFAAPESHGSTSISRGAESVKNPTQELIENVKMKTNSQAGGVQTLFRGADPNPGFGVFFSDHISESLETIFWIKILKFFYADPDSGSGTFLTLDPG